MQELGRHIGDEDGHHLKSATSFVLSRMLAGARTLTHELRSNNERYEARPLLLHIWSVDGKLIYMAGEELGLRSDWFSGCTALVGV